MKYIELQYAFELESANLDAPLNGKLPSDDIVYWLNQGVDKFIKTRYNGSNPKLTAFEQDEKRARDLMNLVKTETIVLTTKDVQPSHIEFKGTYPEDLMFVLDENVRISKPDGSNIRSVEIFECTMDTYMYRITNSLTDFHYRHGYARPLRVRRKDGLSLFTDTKYIINHYDVTYVRKPNRITLDNPFEEYTDFPEYAQNEIVKLAVQMYLESVASPRYQTKINENNEME